MDEADMRLLYYLDLNSRCPVKKLASLTGMRADRLESRLDSLFKSGTIRRCYPEINRSKLGYRPFKVYLQFQRLDPEKLTEIYDYLASLPNIGWVVTCSGRWDMIFAVWAKNVDDFYRAYEDFLSRYHPHILRKVSSISVEFFLSNKKWLCDDAAHTETVRVGGVPNNVIDDADSRILMYLGKDGRASVVTIAESVGMEAQEVDDRIRRMQKDGVILSFRTDLDVHALNRTFCKSFLYLTRSSKEEEKRLLDYCFRHPEIISIVRCVGPWDLEIEAHCRSFNDFTEMMNDIRNRYSALVRNFEAVVINKETGMRYAPRGTGSQKVVSKNL